MTIADFRPVRWMTRFLDRLTKHQAGEQATIIAFNIIYAMFPLALSLTAIGGFLFHGAAARAQIIHEVRVAFPEQLAGEITDLINTAGTHPELIGVIGLVSLLWAGSNLFAAVEVSFARIFSVPPRGIVQQRIAAFLMIFAFSALLVLSVAAANVVVLLGQRARSPFPFPVGRNGEYLGVLGGWVFSTLLHLVIYLVIPNVRLPFRALWPGAVLAGTSLQVTTLVFPLYIRYLGGINRFGDAFSLVFLVMTWAYFLAFILLAGAELNALYYAPVPQRRDGGGDAAASSPPPDGSSQGSH